MAAIFFTTGNKPRATARIRQTATGQPQSLQASIADGDTIGTQLEGSTSVRLLGIDSHDSWPQ